MSLLLKKKQTFKLTEDQERRAKRAARIVSRQRGRKVGVGTLLREEGMKGIDLILEAAAAVAPAAGEAA